MGEACFDEACRSNPRRPTIARRAADFWKTVYDIHHRATASLMLVLAGTQFESSSPRPPSAATEKTSPKVLGGGQSTTPRHVRQCSSTQRTRGYWKVGRQLAHASPCMRLIPPEMIPQPRLGTPIIFIHPKIPTPMFDDGVSHSKIFVPLTDEMQYLQRLRRSVPRALPDRHSLCQF